ncbi:MAG: hypothetical protein JXP34_10505 [Planctomycetes bacterium]|nr:hypothetical protein [Planctomycetota bacterium]
MEEARGPGRTDTTHVVRHGAIIFILSNVGSLFLLLFQRTMALHLPAGDFGAMNALLNAFTLVMGLACVPLQTVAARRAARFAFSAPEGTIGGLFGTWLLRSIILSIATIAPFALLRAPIARFLHIEDPALLPILFAGVPAAFLVAAAGGVLQGLQWFWRLGLALCASGAFRYLLGLGVVVLALGLRAAIAVQALAALATLALIVATAAAGFRGRSAGASERSGSGRDLHLPIFAGVALLTALQQLDLILVKHYWPDDARLVDRYAAAQVMGRIVLFAPAALVSVITPKAVTRAIMGSDPRPVLLRALAATMLLGVATLAAFAAIPDVLFHLLGKGRFAGSGDLLLLYGVAMLFLGILHMLTHYLSILSQRAFLLLLAGAVAAEVLWIDAGHATAAAVIGKLAAVFAAASIVLLVAIFRPGGWTAPRDAGATLAAPAVPDYATPPPAGSAPASEERDRVCGTA